ncbi:uncharacterized protein LOC106136068 [Amyelois transitella]|uniref:uncharacterized protein LOC106136068 n=1 Tax=Amyelois transitella TaxID=680683 RepID=UPI00067B1741|nr:uncharacterized protein LOC106136068 [Amyelois transitella]
MYKAWFIICALCSSEAFNPLKCQEKPQEKHCLIEWMVRDRWPHTVRYVYDWVTRKCFEIRWSDHCPDVPVPTTSNNFPSEDECLDQCSGWN